MRPSARASSGAKVAALPQTSLVIGFGHSWSQALLAKLPSQALGSGRKTTVSPPTGVAGWGGAGSRGGDGVTATAAVPSITPSCNA